MGLYMELESGKDFRLGTSPKTVLPSKEYRLRVENRNSRRKPTRRKDLPSLDEEFKDNIFGIPSNCTRVEGDESLKRGSIYQKRGSIYQSSNAVRKMKELRALENRRKVEKSCSSDSYVSFRIADSLCSLDDGGSVGMEQKKPPVRSRSSSLSKMSTRSPHKDLCPNNYLEFNCAPSSPSNGDGFFEIVLDLDKRDAAERVDIDSVENPKFKCDQVVGPLNDGNGLHEGELFVDFQKSSSAQVQMHYSPSPSDSDCSRDSPRPRFQKIFDPFMKPKPPRSSLGSTMGSDEVTVTCMAGNRRNKTFRKSLLHDFSNEAPYSESRSEYHTGETCSPVHLKGYLKLEYRNGMPCFEFSVKCPEDAFVAKTWKADNGFNWVYTFHSVHSRKKSNSSSRGTKDSNRDSSMVGQMQVSCYLCSEMKHSGAMDNSFVTEFVSYDVSHARKSANAKESSNCSPNVWDSPKFKAQQNHAFDDAGINCSTLHPWAQSDLHPYLEVAAVVFQVPFEKRESVKYKRGDKTSPAKVKVITATGNHSLPESTESQGPSSLLDRWRSGGGCDCGGWDMACPLIVFGNQRVEECPLVENHQPLQLFVQGGKEKMPALTMKLMEEGKYAVDFHAQMSALQAFSICVAMLHGAEVSTSVVHEGNRQVLQNNPLKMLIEEEVKFLIDAVTEEEKRKATKPMQKIPPSFVVNPPFSPIARV